MTEARLTGYMHHHLRRYWGKEDSGMVAGPGDRVGPLPRVQ